MGFHYDPPPLNETFAVEDGHLVRRVVPARGRPYAHRCPLADFEAVAHAIDELKGGSFTQASLRDGTGLRWTQVATALAFLTERGIIDTAPPPQAPGRDRRRPPRRHDRVPRAAGGRPGRASRRVGAGPSAAPFPARSGGVSQW